MLEKFIKKMLQIYRHQNIMTSQGNNIDNQKGGLNMATKSILKTVYIKNDESAKRLASALENASKKRAKQVKYSRSVSTASAEDIRKMFNTEAESEPRIQSS